MSHSSLHSVYTALVLALSTSSFGLSLTSANSFESILKNESLFTLAVALVYFGALFSNFFIRTIHGSDKVKLVIANILFVLGYSLPFLGFDFNILAVSRFIIGTAFGIVNAIVPLYISNISPQKAKTFLTTLNSAGCSLGIALGHYLNVSFDSHAILRYIILFTAVQTFLLIFILPNKAGQTHFFNSCTNLFENQKALKALLIALSLHISQQLSGINYMTIFTNRLFTDKHASVKFNSIATAVIFLSGYILNTLGKRTALMFSVACVIGSMLLIQFRVLDGLSVIIYFIGFNSGLSSIPWTCLDELFEESALDFGSWFAISTNYLMAFLMTYGVSLLTKFLGNYHFYFYIVSMSIASLVLWIVYKPESMLKTPQLE
ncbi:uncharacterized protein VICG_00345 [Vittaforma corneae ATCC 50505]|uniref:Major facilitator superfamily (MFS) profile domain-containing protein n=1 Tax=Vittaforma corneae (strain ATCC 50505) TaxID=993615 RepID=L2GP05_VITCO|nr:uncharacterized protein VICG_00345 [Vittaforma corneae ATCC 50505]ELA42593.1 hypothetical protein VICG_00345 [Vittaforma corneae ATCC 50505]